MIKILLIAIASIVGFAALFYIVLRLASRKMRRAATTFVVAVMEERFRDAHDMLSSNLADLDHRQFIGWIKQLGLRDLVRFRRYPGDYNIGVGVGAWSPLFVREDGVGFTATFHLRKTDKRWSIEAIESGAQVLSEKTIRPDPVVERAEARKMFKRQRRHVKAVFNKHVAEHGCPCAWKQFLYWTGKPHGRGRQDELQNDLVQVALDSGVFEATTTAQGLPEVAASFRCKRCDALWQHFSEEWRMGATSHRLHRVSGRAEDTSAWQGFESDRIFQTVGAEPVPGAFTLSLDEWRLFMDAPLPSASEQPS